MDELDCVQEVFKMSKLIWLNDLVGILEKTL